MASLQNLVHVSKRQKMSAEDNADYSSNVSTYIIRFEFLNYDYILYFKQIIIFLIL